MPYDPRMIQPFRDELTQAGFTELFTAAAVDASFTQKGTTLVVVNSVCGCAAGQARPGVALAVKHPLRPERLVTVFAGQDLEATSRARSYFTGAPPSSPSIGILRDGKLVYLLQRHEIQTMDARAVAGALGAAFETVSGGRSAATSVPAGARELPARV
ncbi:MAG: BrxA/BrxB family bacilliredoxin [Thermoanaerobaculia bacterium]|nr:BrxA/BrxB family bacilliredoxin [Thermoanaerobaculia bacterium]